MNYIYFVLKVNSDSIYWHCDGDIDDPVRLQHDIIYRAPEKARIIEEAITRLSNVDLLVMTKGNLKNVVRLK